MTIRYEHGVIKVSVKKGDEISEDLGYYASSFGFLLNTSERRGKAISFVKFAGFIEEIFDKNDPRTLAAIDFFKKLDAEHTAEK